MPSNLLRGAGALRQRVTIQERVPNETSGADAPYYKSIKTVWASVEPLSGRELFIAQQVQAQVTHKVRVRYTKEVALSPKRRFLFGDRKLSIDSVANADERNVYLDCMCTEWIEAPAGASSA